MSQEYPGIVSVLTDKVKKLGKLYLENAKLTATEKLSLLLSGIVMFIAVCLLGISMLIFLVLCAASALEAVLAPYWSFLIVAGIFAVMIVCIFVFRDTLVINPIVKLVSKMMLNPPKSTSSDEK